MVFLYTLDVIGILFYFILFYSFISFYFIFPLFNFTLLYPDVVGNMLSSVKTPVGWWSALYSLMFLDGVPDAVLIFF